MTQVGAPRHDTVPIGDEARPPFARLPDLHSLFARRAERLTALASGHQLEAYLRFVSGLVAAQDAIQNGLPDPAVPPQDQRDRAREFGMPPLDRNRFAADAVFE